MLIDKEKIKAIEAEQKLHEKRLMEVEEEIKCAVREKTKELLISQRHNILTKIRGCKSQIELEESRHNYTDVQGYQKMKELSKHLGKEVRSTFGGDKNTPQILLGLRYKDDYDDPSYSNPRWVATIRFRFQGQEQTRECFVDGVYILKK